MRKYTLSSAVPFDRKITQFLLETVRVPFIGQTLRLVETLSPFSNDLPTKINNCQIKKFDLWNLTRNTVIALNNAPIHFKGLLLSQVNASAY